MNKTWSSSNNESPPAEFEVIEHDSDLDLFNGEDPTTTLVNYLKTLYGGATTGSIVIFTLPDRRHQRFPVSETEAAAKLIIEKGRNCHTYISWALHNDSETRTNDSAIAVPGFTLDVDLAHGVHKKAARFPDSIEQALEILSAAGLPPPTIVISSGGGAYFQWLFTEPFTIGNDSDREWIASAMEAWNAKAIEAFKSHDLQLDKTSDLGRVYRAIGTLNFKFEDPRPATLLQYHPVRRWTPAELARFAPPKPKSRPTARTDGSKLLADELKNEFFNAADPDKADEIESMRALLAGCRFVAACDEQADRLPEPWWKILADILARQPMGREVFHRLSSRDPRYDQNESEKKVERAAEFPPRKCESISKEFDGCSSCSFRYNSRMKSPTVLLGQSPSLVELQRELVLDAKTGLFHEYAGMHDMTTATFNRFYARNIGRNAAEKFSLSSTSLIVHETDYLPGNVAPVCGPDDWQVLNLWRNGGVEAKEGDPTIWLSHFSLLIPDDAHCAWFIQYLAHSVQKPSVKIKSAVMIQSEPGIGKGVVAALLKRLFGDHNVRERFGGIINERWQASCGNVQILVLDELDIAEKAGSNQRIKRWISEEKVEVERKGVDEFEVRTPRALFIYTNLDRPLVIDRRDRRLFIVKVDAQRRSSDYYDQLWTEGLSDSVVAAVKHFLLSVDLSGFKPDAEPPMTEAKLDLEALSNDTLTAAISELQEDRAQPFHRAVFHVDEVMEAVAERTGRKNGRRTAELALKRAGARRIPDGRINLGGKRGRKCLWVWREHETWLSASPDELRAEFERRTPDDADDPLLPDRVSPALSPVISRAIGHAKLVSCQVPSASYPLSASSLELNKI
ncbi:primase-helicase family protein [Bradyrhizobium sp. JYMT SZCCT0428]|uniref:primase-helicase family protein n=1 Tax=Bradyrhizobium sp. JYMT SZCCT0428 TaxID=2807673 RepID=UPI001BA75EB9|nr:DUF5906 domain-containing protein [Bradyrhizobium sp. JYMT SZCCT0428]MBR1149478.1 hypothetical protein [Bradyrhizobium sp. JYMT SZCCT0428]